ncbi:MAG: DUF1559 domain-containing protein [Gemmatales bacterium]
MSHRSLYLAVMAFLLSTLGLHAQTDEANRKHLARFLSDQTLMVGKIDLTQIDVNASFDLLLGMKLPVHDQLVMGKAKVAEIKAALLQAGAERFYLVYNQMELFQWPVVYVPLKDVTQAETVASLIAHLQPGPFPNAPSWLAPGREAGWKVIDNYVVVGNANAIQALTTIKTAQRPEFHAACTAIKDAPVQLLIMPTNDFRKIVAETMPLFPKELGQGSTAVISKGLQWAVVAAGLPPRLRGQLLMQTEEPGQAQEFQKLWTKMLGSLKQETDSPRVSTIGKTFYQLINSIQANTSQNQFTLDATEDRLKGIATILGQTLSSNMTDELNASNLRQLVIAMHNFHGDFNRLPNQAICDKDGKPLLSWRVAMLPYLEQDQLYKQFKLDEPWDSDHNKKLIDKMPKCYVHPFAKNVPANHTLYQVFFSKQGAKPAAAIMETGKMTLGMLSVQDGTSNTFIVTDAAAEAVPWTKPADLLYDGTVENLPKMVSPRGDGWAHVGFGDAHVSRFKPGGKPKLLWQMIGRNDGANEDNSEIFVDK